MRFAHLSFDGLLSFGAPTVGEVRPTDIFPACSMIVGLLANALGYEHTERKRIQDLQSAINMGTRVDWPGSRLIDFQTFYIGKKLELWRSDSFVGKANETHDGTAIRRKHFLSDSVIHTVVGTDATQSDALPSTENIAHALTYPFRVLFIGRYCCIPYSPLFRGIIEADSVYSALEQIPSKFGTGPFEAECPVTSSTTEKRNGLIIERQDLRDWTNDVHSGSRLVWRGPIQGVNA
ncbi:MAG: type I-E CRISPR-associated protein Cas5/CasD [Synergistales bacterium]|nr:type I-E CRISPR-associated protein Cas5/CasD [Synergistales bacterium]